MNLKSLRKLLALGLIAVAGQSWATPSQPPNGDTTWQNISNIEWSTDNGVTWGSPSTVAVGQSVEFKITMDKTNIGNHYADFVKAWIDLNGDGQFETNEVVLFGSAIANATPQNWWNPERPYTGQPYTFTSSAITVSSAMGSNLWMLARVTCSDSLMTAGVPSYHPLTVATWNTQWTTSMTAYNSYFSPTGTLGQGNSELVHLGISNRVPEPGTLALFAVAMVGAGWTRKRASRV
jgi:PEP-CTERM motif